MDIPKPKMLSDIVCIAEEIGKHFPFIRVDFYISKGKIYVGELTGLPFNALGPYEKDDFVLGKKLVLPTMEEIRTNYKEVFDAFPELLINPIYLKGKNPNYKIIQPNNTNSTLPELPALLFLRSLYYE